MVECLFVLGVPELSLKQNNGLLYILLKLNLKLSVLRLCVILMEFSCETKMLESH
jgi:hypothetical protein